MSRDPCACADASRTRTPKRPFFFTSILFLIIAIVLSSTGICRAQPAIDRDQVIVNVNLNTVDKGDVIAFLTPEKDFLIGVDELKEMGFVDPKGALAIIQQKPYISLKSMNGVTFAFDEKKLVLNVSAAPELLAAKTLDFKPQRPSRVYYPRDNSAFLNYGVSYASEFNNSGARSLNITNEAGVRLNDILFLTETTYTNTAAEDNFIRLQSSAVYDFRQDMRRLTAGDFFATSGDLGSSVNVGGLSYSKLYSMNPYFIRQPLFNFTGQTNLPSEADIYVDGVLVRREKLSPGTFELQNIQYYGGYRNVDVVIRDAFGREQRIQNPFFFNDILLKKGLSEYSYNVGFLRENYGVKSNDYGKPAFSAFHRYGLSDSVTIGFRAEGSTENLANFGPTISFLEKNIGIFTASVSQGVGDYTGLAGLFSHTYQSKWVSTQVYVQGNSRDYRTLASKDQTDIVRFQLSAGIGYSSKEFGSLYFNYGKSEKYVGIDTETWGSTYQRQITDKTQLTLSYSHSNQYEYGDRFGIRLTWYPGQDTTVALAHDRDDKADTTSFQVQKNAPIGEGYGYRFTAQQSNDPESSRNYVNPFFQLNGKYGIYTAEYRGEYAGSGNTESYQVSASGGIVYVGKTVGLTRPVYDSFGLVKVGNLKDVEVSQNNQVVGKTNSAGKVFIPTMNSFSDNFVSINDKNIPLNYSAHYINREVSPPFRSGSVIPFEITRVQGITGTVSVRAKGTIKPMEFEELRISIKGKDVPYTTGKGGEFYMENVPPGRYTITFEYVEKTLSFDIIVPDNEDTIIDLGKITVETD